VGGLLRGRGLQFLTFLAASVEIKRRTIYIGKKINFYLFKVLKMFPPFAHLLSFSKCARIFFCIFKWSYKKRKILS
jgi:hypothetical protein